MCIPSKVLTIYYHTKAGVGGNSREVHPLPNGHFLRNKGGDFKLMLIISRCWFKAHLYYWTGSLGQEKITTLNFL
jgi:hypothetical protein